MLVVDKAGYAVEPLAPCWKTAGAGGLPRTDAVSCPTGTFVKLYLGDGDDYVFPVDMARWFDGIPLYVSGGPGVDVIRGTFASNFFDGGAGDDKLIATIASRAAWINGGNGNDEIRGGPFPDVLSGGGGNDDISGHDGNDTIKGGAGDDRLGAYLTMQPNGTNVKQPDQGMDTYLAGPGNDIVNSDWDSASDDVKCQGGYDDADVEGRDTTAGCERLH